MRKSVPVAWFCVVLVALAATASGADVSVKAAVEPAVIPMGSEATLVVTVEGQFRKTTNPEIPAVEGLSFYQAGTSQSFSFINGERRASLQFTYVIRAHREGRYSIQPIRFETGGKLYTAAPVVLEVVASPSQIPQASDESQTASERSRGKPLFIAAKVDRDTVYVNQQVTWSLGFYTDGRVDLLRSPEYSPPSAEGFWVEELPPQRNYYTTIDGHKFLVNEIKRAFFPTTPGTHTIGAARVDVVVDDASTRSFDDFFNLRRGLFGFGRQTALRSDPIVVTVLPLPEKGKPANFSGFVGRNLAMSLRVDKQVVQAGEPVNVTLEITGEGNFKTVAAPPIPKPDGFKAYESGSLSDLRKVDYKVTGRKKTDFVLIPKVEGSTVIPPIQMSYFDPVEKKYKLIQTSPVQMDIRPAAREEGGRQVIFAGSGEDIEVLGKDINYIHPVPGHLATGARAFYHNPLYAAAHLLPLLALLVSFAVQRRRSRFSGDVRLARASRAAREAERVLKSAAAMRKRGQWAASFAAVSGALRGYFADKMNVSASGLTMQDIEAFLGARSVDSEEIGRLRSLLDLCDALQYSPASVEPDRARQTAKHGLELIRRFEREYLR